MKNKPKKTAIAGLIMLMPFIGGCYPGPNRIDYSGNSYYNTPRGYYQPQYCNPRTHIGCETPGYQGSSRFIVRDSSGRIIQRGGAVWSNPPRTHPHPRGR